MQSEPKVPTPQKVEVYSVRRHANSATYTCFRNDVPHLTSDKSDAERFLRSMKALFPSEQYKLHIHLIEVPVY